MAQHSVNIAKPSNYAFYDSCVQGENTPVVNPVFGLLVRLFQGLIIRFWTTTGRLNYPNTTINNHLDIFFIRWRRKRGKKCQVNANRFICHFTAASDLFRQVFRA